MLVRLIDLEPQFVRWCSDGSLARVADVDQAHGLRFLCPVCWTTNEGPIGTHTVICWFAGRGVPGDAVPGPGRWTVRGRTFADLTLDPSVHLVGQGCGWHGWVRQGDVT